MLEPIYFPFTYVPQWVAETLAAGFKHFMVYQPSGKKLPAEMQIWVEKNAMRICVPVSAEDKSFTEIVRALQRFARLHTDVSDLRTTTFWNRQGAIPFFNETSASQIVADLKKNEGPDAGPADSKALLRARVFLEFAQEFDRQNADMQRELDDTDRRSEDLLKNLSGQKDNDSPLTGLTAEINVDDPGEFMAQDRLQAWIRLFMEKPIDSGFLVTSSPSIFYSLVEDLVPTEKLFESKRLPDLTVDDDAVVAWRETFYHQIKNVIESEGLTAEDAFALGPRLEDYAPRFILTVYRLPARAPAQVFARLLKSPNCAKTESDQRPEIKNTLLGLIERNPLEL